MNILTRAGRILIITTAMILPTMLVGGMKPPSAMGADDTIDAIIAGVEERYNVPGFTADFDQESILKAMAVTDVASGKLMIRQPDKMRWE